MLSSSELLLLGVAITFLAFRYYQSKKNLPPGPRGLPLVGNLLQMRNTKPHLKMAEWADKYGKLYTVTLGSNPNVVLNDPKLIKEVLNDSNFSDRPDQELMELFTGGKHGIITTNGVPWEEQRRWTLRKLRDHGFGKTSMEGIIMDEANAVVDVIKSKKGSPIKVNDYLDIGVLNSLWTLLNGDRVEQNDPQIRGILDAINDIFPAVQRSGLLLAPWLKHILPSLYKEIEKAADRLLSFVRTTVKQHFDTHQEGSARDYIDEYISEIKKTTAPSSSFHGHLGKKHLIGTISDLLQAGSVTTSNTLTWACGYLSWNPSVQEKLRSELHTVLGDRSVALSDKPNLPYTEAVIMETLRRSSLVALGVQHQAISDKQVHGFTIPKGMYILTNIYYVHHNPAIWGDPHNFRPERFLSPDGKKVVRNENLIPFQIGRRQCIGESLARDTLFLFMATMFQNFSVTMVENCEPQPHDGFVLFPKTYEYIFKYEGMKS